MKLIDIGANLCDSAFDKDRAEVVARAQEAGVEHLVLTGTSIEVSRQCHDFAITNRKLFSSTAGIHPHHAKDLKDGDIQVLRELAQTQAAVAVGECGLDFNRDFSPRPQQIECFEAQLELAAELSLPVFIHERDAADTMIPMLRAWRHKIPRAVIHCFTGDLTTLRAYLDLDLHIGITGWICDERRGHALRDAVCEVPDQRLMVESDAPYLLPRTIRPRPKSRRNEPATLPHVVGELARCCGREASSIAHASYMTSLAFFDL